MAKTILLTKTQAWFIGKAIDLQDAVLPLSDESLTDKQFKQIGGEEIA